VRAGAALTACWLHLPAARLLCWCTLPGTASRHLHRIPLLHVIWHHVWCVAGMSHTLGGLALLYTTSMSLT
jgi:hypothetical protein